MGAIVLPNGYNLSMPYGNFLVCPPGNTTGWMLTIAETRRARLETLIAQHGGTIANLNEALGYERNDTRLARIRNANSRTDRPGKVFQMGDPQAREIEARLGLERGWMDTPPGYAEEDWPTPLRQLRHVAESLAPYQVEQLAAIAATLAGKAADDASRIDAHQQRYAKPMHTAPALSDASKGLAPVKNAITQKKIGRGMLGPPADQPKGTRRESSKAGRGPRKGHA